MKEATGTYLAFVTAPDADTARMLARAALEARLIACANLVAGVESHYWWQEKIESSGEVFLVLKTTGDCLEALEKLMTEKHPYDTPEFIAVPIQAGNQKYLAWLAQSVSPESMRKTMIS